MVECGRVGKLLGVGWLVLCGGLVGAAVAALVGWWGGWEGGGGGVGGSPGSLLEVWGSVLDDFLDVWIFGIHPQNNQDKKNIVYITSTITRAIKLDTFRLYVIKTNGLKTYIIFTSL